MSEPLSWVDGRLVPAGEARISAADRGFLLGEGVFDTLLAIDGVPRAVGRHLARLRRGAAALGLAVPYDDAELRAALAAVAEAGPPRARVRIDVSAGAVVIGAFPVVERGDTAAVVTSPWPANERSPLAGLKHTSRADLVLAMAHAQAHGADEALLATTDGRLCEGTGSNVFVVLGGRLLTPSLASGCLPGVARELVLELVGAEEVDVPIAALAEVEEAFLTSSTRGVHPIAVLDGRHLPTGPRTAAAQAAYDALLAADVDP